MLIGVFGAVAARRPATLIACRRIVEDPRTAWRTVSTTGLAVVLAGLSTAATWWPPDDRLPYLGRDLTTGSLIALLIACVVATTTTAVVQLGTAYDRRDQYRALARLGTDATVLHRARALEVALPLGAAVTLGGGLVMLILLPFAAVAGPDVLVRYAAAIAAAVLISGLGVLAGRPLVATLTRLDP